jgi:hypothetical protein
MPFLRSRRWTVSYGVEELTSTVATSASWLNDVNTPSLILTLCMTTQISFSLKTQQQTAG